MAPSIGTADRRAEALAAIRASQERTADHRASVLRHTANLRRLIATLSNNGYHAR